MNNDDQPWRLTLTTRVCCEQVMHDQATAQRCVATHQRVAMWLAAGVDPS